MLWTAVPGTKYFIITPHTQQQPMVYYVYVNIVLLFLLQLLENSGNSHMAGHNKPQQ